MKFYNRKKVTLQNTLQEDLETKFTWSEKYPKIFFSPLEENECEEKDKDNEACPFAFKESILCNGQIAEFFQRAIASNELLIHLEGNFC